jgi:hypothetical protein
VLLDEQPTRRRGAAPTAVQDARETAIAPQGAAEDTTTGERGAPSETVQNARKDSPGRATTERPPQGAARTTLATARRGRAPTPQQGAGEGIPQAVSNRLGISEAPRGL